MTPLQELAAALSDALSRASPLAPAILVGATLVEYVFPPFPGDLVVVLGAWWAVQGQLSWPATFAAVTAGALAGSWIDWRLGAWIGRRLELRATLPTVVHRVLTPERLAAFEEGYRRWGGLLIAGNRFLPGVRAFLFVAAGVARVPLRKVLFLGAISAVAWNALLLGAGSLVAHNLDDLLLWFDRYTRAAGTLVVVAALVLAAIWALRRRRAAARRRAGEP
ncbi:MAG TPA: DedA family protein [Anaeromyxobacter sp.]